MQNESHSESSVFTNGKLRVDYAAGCANLNDKELHLTPIEYKLLCLLELHVEALDFLHKILVISIRACLINGKQLYHFNKIEIEAR